MESSDDYGKITDEQRKFISQWVGKKLAGKKATCPLCQTTEWEVLEHMLELRPYTVDGRLIVGGSLYPHFALACKNCGFTALVNAVAADVLPRTIIKMGGKSDGQQ